MGLPAVTSIIHMLGLILFFIFLQIIQPFQFLAASPVLQSHLQRRLVDDDSGFISIDCGLTEASYFDSTTGLNYTSDEKYISTGNNMVSQVSSGLYKTLRSFPEGLRNCYNLSPLKPYNKYLIRAQFTYGNYDGKNSIPRFDVHIGVNYWHTFTASKNGTEIIHVATRESVDVCLVNIDKGTPFISVLELRPLDYSSYPEATPQLSLKLRHREDTGGLAATNGGYMVRDDDYNREWYMYKDWDNVISTTESFDGSQADPFKVPKSVLSTARESTITSPDIAISHGMNGLLPLYFYWHFAELQSHGYNDTREFDVIVPGYTLGPISPKYLQLTTLSSPEIDFNGSKYFGFTLTKTSRSSLYPILNAYEVYFSVNLTMSPTNQEDVDAIAKIKVEYAITRNWQGDPCLPVNYQWEGLSCTKDANINSTRINSFNLSSSNLTGELPPSLSNLTSLTYLNLSNNAFTGKIPDFLAYLPSLSVIDLSGNNLTGPVPHELAQKASNKSVDLRLAGNPVCSSYPCGENGNVKEKSVASKKRHSFVVPIVACVASVSLLVIIYIIFLVFKRTKKQGLVDGAIKPKNMQFNSLDIVRITDNFKKVLGKGGFGTVYYGVLQDGTAVAVKLLKHTSSTISLKQFCAEAELLTRTHHVNLVSLVGYCNEHANMALVYEYMSCGDLQAQLSAKNEHPLSWKARLQISIDAAQGLEYLHSGCRPPIIHRDIKPANILLDQTGHAKIADFGLSRFCTTDSQGDVRTGLAGTRGYLDPEYCKHQLINTLSEKSDVYAFGVVMLQLLTGQPILVKNTNYQQDEYDIGHIVAWVSPKVENGDILAIIDKRLKGDLIVNSAWMFVEIAMGCVKPTGNERPRMSEVVANLKVCYALEECREQNAEDGIYNGNYGMNSSQALDTTSLVSLPT